MLSENKSLLQPIGQLLYKMQQHPQNGSVLLFLKATTETHFEPWSESSQGMNEGAQIFFDDYGRLVPAIAKFLLGVHSLMVNEVTGEIFAFHTGRLSIFFKCDVVRSGIENTHSLREGDTLDGITDITMLGDCWSFLNKFAEDETEQLLWAYERTQIGG